jgi:hypothetical protein
MHVLFEDDHIIVVDKPAHVLSVPGREGRVDQNFISRSEQWMNAVAQLHAQYAETIDIPESLRIISARLVEAKHTIPRQKERFFKFLSKACKVEAQDTKAKVWHDLTVVDQQQNGFDSLSLPPQLQSAADFVERLTSNKVFHVHRLDQETSGILMFAKSSQAARELSRQFREKEVGTQNYVDNNGHSLLN